MKLNTYHKPTYSGLLLNFHSFTPFSYKTSLIKCLIDRAFKISNNPQSFEEDLKVIKDNLIKNSYPPPLINKIVNNFLNKKHSNNENETQSKPEISYFKLPYIGKYSDEIKCKKLHKLAKKYRKDDFNIKIVFNSFKIKNYFSYKDLVPNDLKSFLVYKFTCAHCNVRYIGETTRHFKKRIGEHLRTDRQSHVFKHLSLDPDCFDKSDAKCFKILDKANSQYSVKIKEALHIDWEKPELNTQVRHYNITLSV